MPVGRIRPGPRQFRPREQPRLQRCACPNRRSVTQKPPTFSGDWTSRPFSSSSTSCGPSLELRPPARAQKIRQRSSGDRPRSSVVCPALLARPAMGGGPRRRPPKQWPALLARGGGVHDPAQASSCATSAGRTNATERGRVVPLRLHDAVAAGGTARFCDADFFACARHVAVRCIRPAAAASASCLCGRRFQPGLRLRVAATAPYRTLWGDMCTW